MSNDVAVFTHKLLRGGNSLRSGVVNESGEAHVEASGTSRPIPRSVAFVRHRCSVAAPSLEDDEEQARSFRGREFGRPWPLSGQAHLECVALNEKNSALRTRLAFGGRIDLRRIPR